MDSLSFLLVVIIIAIGIFIYCRIQNNRRQILLEEEVEQEEEWKRKAQQEEEEKTKAQQEEEEKRKAQQEEEEKRKVEQERIKQEEEQKRKAELEKIKYEEWKRKAEQERVKYEEWKRKAEQERIKYEEQKRKVEQERIKQEEEQKRKAEQERIRKEQIIKYNIIYQIRIFILYQQIINSYLFLQQHLQPIFQQQQIQQEISTKPIQQQIQILSQEINRLDNNPNLTNNQKQHQKYQYQQQLIRKLKDKGEVKTILYVKQNIEPKNPHLALFVLKESLLRDQNRELLATSKQYSFGFDSIIGAYGQDLTCFKVRNTNLDYDKIVKDNRLLQQHLLEFQQKLSSSLNISIELIEILGVSKESFEINFQIKGKNIDEIQEEIKNKPEAQKFLNEYCNGKIEYLAYFDKARADGDQGILLSTDDFNPQYNMSWENFQEKQERGPPYHRYDYYFPRDCYGFGLDIKKYGSDDWIKKNGNLNEWRIMYHGTKNFAVNQIVRNNFEAGSGQAHQNCLCIDEFGKKVAVGKGIYFSDKHTVSQKYTTPVQVVNKKFNVYFMSRVNPKKIRQCEKMKQVNYFVVNKSEDIRPYRILIQEVK